MFASRLNKHVIPRTSYALRSTVTRQSVARPSSVFVRCLTQSVTETPSEAQPPAATPVSEASQPAPSQQLRKRPLLLQPTVTRTPLDRYVRLLDDAVEKYAMARFDRLIQEMKDKEVLLEGQVMNLIAQMKAKRGHWNEAFKALEEIRQAGFPVTDRTYLRFLEANAGPTYTPDRAELIMENMARDLIPMTAQAYDFLIAGRSYHEPEHALRTLQEVNARGLTPLSSSYVSVIHAFTRTKEPDVALAVLREGERRDNMPIFSYFDVMEASADAKYAEGVDHCWKTLMANKILVHEGACLKLLRYAASTGKAALAGEVVRHLTNQNYKCGAEHLGPLFEAFVRANDSAAFGVLELMEKAGIPIDRGIVSVWTEQLSTSIEALNRGIRQLQQLNMPREDGSLRGPVHVALFNSILDAAVALGNIELAAETFQSASKYGVKPNVDSYNAMLVVCRELKQINVANELYEEMLRNNIQPNRTTFHRLVSVACSVERDESYEDAFKYLELTKAAGMIPNFNTYVELARRCAISRDARATIVLEEMETFGYPVSDELKQFVESGGLSDKLQTLKESNQRFGRPNKTIPRAILSSKNISIR